jgi:RNA-directed DNA polymerase
MKEPYIEGVATHDGPESYAGAREDAGEALTGVRAGRVSSREIRQVWGVDAVVPCGRPHVPHRKREVRRGPTRSETPGTCGGSLRVYREILGSPAVDGTAGRTGKAKAVRRW